METKTETICIINGSRNCAFLQQLLTYDKLNGLVRDTFKLHQGQNIKSVQKKR